MLYSAKIKKFGVYQDNVYPYVSMTKVKSLTGCDIICNGMMFDMSTGKAVCNMKLDGEIQNRDIYSYYGYGWNGSSLGKAGVLPTMSNNMDKWDNFISCVEMIRDGKKQTMYYPAALGGSRGRTAIGFKKDGTFVLWCSSDSFEPKTMEQLQQLMYDAGCYTAINLDGGGSSECITPVKTITTARTIFNYICIWLEDSEKEKEETVSNATCPYTMPTTLIRYGQRGVGVYWLQWQLERRGYSVDGIDGDFGQKTLAAVKLFQKAEKLEVDGVVGNATKTALLAK